MGQKVHEDEPGYQIILHHTPAMKVAVNLGRRTGSGHCPSYLGEDCAEHSQDVTFGLGPYYVSIKGYVDIRF